MPTTGLSPYDPMISERTACLVKLQRVYILLSPEGLNFFKFNCFSHIYSCRYQSKKRRPFSRYTSRADNKVRREKSFVTGGVTVEDQLIEIRGNLVNIQGENSLIKRNMDLMKGKYDSVTSSHLCF